MVIVWLIVDKSSGAIHQVWRKPPSEAMRNFPACLGDRCEVVEMEVPTAQVSNLASMKLVGGQLVNASMVGL